ncbi:hypothetical protein RG963_13185 [Methanosarcina sp. Z-7115]|uniref:Uncharacterized protein n=1 Tax=Methanosarcina baikalica TaxID=3073890 RepID=A0ABU2D416_9EURY|nr:hypothetical protein [Methanosarcina sp. Z-7115]MDR7666715.1 hypothetical protein [Methanosarcina sp. Z-7115]
MATVGTKASVRNLTTPFSSDKMVHGDFGIDLEALWNITVKDVSSLKPLIAKI